MLSLFQIAARKVAVELVISDVKRSDRNINDTRTLKENTRSLIHENLQLPLHFEEIIIGLFVVIRKQLSDNDLSSVVTAIQTPFVETKPLYSDKFPENFSKDKFYKKFLKSNHFTYLGILDMKKVSVDLMNEMLDTKQKFALACLYGTDNEIIELFELIPEDEKLIPDHVVEFQHLRKDRHSMIQLMWYYLNGQIDKLIIGNFTIEELRLAVAIQSRSPSAVEQCLRQTSNSDILMNAAKQIIAETLNIIIYFPFKCCKAYTLYNSDVSFQLSRNNSTDLISMLLLVFDKMTKAQITIFFQSDVCEGCNIHVGPVNLGIVLLLFLHWSHAHYFMQLFTQFGNLLPKWNFFTLLRCIAKTAAYCENDSYEFRNQEKQYYRYLGQDKAFSYTDLFREFFVNSPDDHKLYLFCYNNGKYPYHNLLCPLWFRSKDNFIIENILTLISYAPIEVKSILITSNVGKEKCMELIKINKIKMVDLFINQCLIIEGLEDFKEELIFSSTVKDVCCYNLINNDMDALNSLIKWSALPIDKLTLYKKIIYYIFYNREIVKISFNINMMADSYKRAIEWCAASQEEVKAYTEEVFSRSFTHEVLIYHLFFGQKAEVDKFIAWGLSEKEEIQEFHKLLAGTFGLSILRELLSQPPMTIKDVIMQGLKFDHCDDIITDTERTVNLITWFFSLEDEVASHLKNTLLKEYGFVISYYYTVLGKRVEAKQILYWLGYCDDEIRGVEKRMILESNIVGERFVLLVDELIEINNNIKPSQSIDSNEDYLKLKQLNSTVDHILKCYLTDNDLALQFKNTCRSQSRYVALLKCDMDEILKFIDNKIDSIISENSLA